MLDRAFQVKVLDPKGQAAPEAALDPQQGRVRQMEGHPGWAVQRALHLGLQ